MATRNAHPRAFRVLWQPAGSVEIRARSNIARLLFDPHVFFSFPHVIVIASANDLPRARRCISKLDRHSVSPNIRSPRICKRIRDTWLTIGREAFLEHGGTLLIFPLKLTCLRDVCFQGGPSHVPSLWKATQVRTDSGIPRRDVRSIRAVATDVARMFVIVTLFVYFSHIISHWPHIYATRNDPWLSIHGSFALFWS